MKRKYPSIIFLVIVVFCLAMIFGGMFMGNNIMVFVGIGVLFGGGFLTSIVMLFFIFRRARKKADELMKRTQDGASADPCARYAELVEAIREDEAAEENRYEELEGALAYSIQGYRRSSVRNKILTIAFLTLTLGSVFAGLICLFFKQFIAAYVLFGCFGATLLVGIAAAIIASCRK